MCCNDHNQTRTNRKLVHLLWYYVFPFESMRRHVYALAVTLRDALATPGNCAVSVEMAQSDEEVDDGDVAFVAPTRALKRFTAGSGQWLDNMYTVQQMKRAHDEEYKEKMRDNWESMKNEYNKKRKERRQAALADLKVKGFPIYTDDEGVHHMDIRCGRKRNPAMVAAVPLAMIQPVGIDDVILLNDPDFLRGIADVIKVPERGGGIFDLQGYLGLKEIIIIKNAVKWGMFHFSTWQELSKGARTAYVGNARRALKNDVVDYIAEHKATAERYFFYDPEQDQWIRDLEDKAAELGANPADLAEEEDKKDLVKVPANRKRVGAAAEKRRPLTQNPLRIVQFMIDVNMDPWKVVLGTCETTQANNKASGLASCCYAYLRNMYSRKENKGVKAELFNKVLEWSFIFERYTRVAKKGTLDRHAAQLTSPEKAANTVNWGEWQAVVYKYLENYFVMSGPKGDKVRIRTKAEGYKPHVKLPNGMVYQMRKRYSKLDDGSKHSYEPDLLPWWRANYNQVRAAEKTDDRPNLRELRDCVMLALYAFLAPIRLDWATVEIKTVDEFKEYIENKEDAERVKQIGDLKFKKNFVKRNILVVKTAHVDEDGELTEEEIEPRPVSIVGAFFNQMKNIKSFAKTPVEKFLNDEDKSRPELASNIILAFLKERYRLNFKSDCLLPFSTYLSDRLAEAEVEEGDEFSRGKTSSKCFTNASFGERIADLAHLLTGKNFTETLFGAVTSRGSGSSRVMIPSKRTCGPSFYPACIRIASLPTWDTSKSMMPR